MIRSLLILCLVLLSACASHNERWSAFNSTTGLQKTGQIEYNGIGGSGRQLDSRHQGLENGLGGSGKTVKLDLQQAQANGLGGSGRIEPSPIENGLGGSGKQIQGKAAILGPISAFGSIWVNDRHIQLPESTEYLIAGIAAKREDLHLGQVVAVLADSLDQSSSNQQRDNEFEAIEVHLLYNVIAPLETDIEIGDRQQFSLLGQTVLLTEATRVLDSSAQVISRSQLKQQAKQGQRIAVSGLRKPNGEIQASLISLASPYPVQLAGPISAIGGQYWLGKQEVKFEQAPDLEQPLSLQGQLESGVFIVDDWAPLPHNRIFELADEVWLEGFPLSDAEFFIEGFEVQLPEFTDDWFDQDDSMSIGIDRREQEFWMDQQPPEFSDDWEQDGWQQDNWQRSAPEPYEDGPYHDEPYNDGPHHDDHYYDDHEYDGPGFDDSEFGDTDYYPPENDHQEHYYPDDFYPYEHNPPPRHP